MNRRGAVEQAVANSCIWRVQKQIIAFRAENSVVSRQSLVLYPGWFWILSLSRIIIIITIISTAILATSVRGRKLNYIHTFISI